VSWQLQSLAHCVAPTSATQSWRVRAPPLVMSGRTAGMAAAIETVAISNLVSLITFIFRNRTIFKAEFVTLQSLLRGLLVI
jgi:hypothetical protein